MSVILTSLGLEATALDIERDAFEAALSRAPDGMLPDSLVNSSSFVDAAFAAIVTPAPAALLSLVISRERVKNWKLRTTAWGAGGAVVTTLDIPVDAAKRGDIPESAEPLVVAAWSTSADHLRAIVQPTESAVLIWRDSARVTMADSQALDLFGKPGSATRRCVWENAVAISVADTSSLIKSERARKLLAVALCSEPASYRLLSFYRLLESVYLSSLLDGINAGFFGNPSKALNEAGDALKAEWRQLVALAANRGLGSQFESLSIEYKRLKNGSRYLSAIDHALSPVVGREASVPGCSLNAQHGCRVLYQIRCSIAHAGSGNVVFEDAPDGDTALSQLLPILEDIVYALLDVTIR